ncbi:peptidase C13 family protein [Cooperia oncophora]
MTAKLLNDALLTMHQQHQFGQLVFYMEACESGSMFKNILKNDINVYAITAANEEESSYATYCDNDLGVPCLGDEFSVNWMEDSDEYDLNYETLDRQFEQVKIWTGASHVMRYGNLSIGEEPVSWFHGAANVKPKIGGSNKNSQHQKTLWPSRDVELMHLLEMKKLHPHSAVVDVEISRIQKVNYIELQCGHVGN